MKKASVQFIVSEKLNTHFDELINCEASSRISDTDFTDPNKVMIRPRPGQETLSNIPESPGWRGIKDMTWFVGDSWIKSWYIWRWGKVFRTENIYTWQYLWTFNTEEDAAILATWLNGDYYIAGNLVYKFDDVGSRIVQPYIYSWTYNNQADLFVDFPTPEDWYFVFLKDSESVYYSDGWWIPFSEYYVFEDLWITLTAGYPAFFNTVSLPTSYQVAWTSTLAATTTEKVNVWSLASPASYVGSYLLITSWVYKGKFWYIFDYATNEFTIVTLWNATPIATWTTFSIFATKWKYLQITNWVDNDLYYSWDGAYWASLFDGYIKTHIGKFASFKDWWPGRITTYGNFCFTSISDTVFISEVAQPLWFNINDTIELQKSSAIDAFFQWKTRMVAYGQNFTTFINPFASSAAERTYDFKNYGIVPGGCAEVLDDFWILTYSWQIIPLSETINGTIIEKKNIGQIIYKYLKTMKQNVTSCFDWRRFYIYGEDKNESGYTCVYDTLYSFWWVYTWIRPAKFLVDNGVVYYAEYGSWNLCKLLKWKVTDDEIRMEQSLSSKDIDGWQVFIMKWIENFALYLENRDQEFTLNMANRTHGDSFNKDYPFNVVQKTANTTTVLWYNGVDSVDTVPQFKNYPMSNDLANIWKWKITNTGNNGFYLNQMQLNMTFPDSMDITNVDL